MSDPAQLTAMQFELAMAIGSSLELDSMLRAVARVILRCINATAIAVYVDAPRSPARRIFQTPRHAALPPDLTPDACTSPGNCCFVIPGFGTLLVEHTGSELGASTQAALQPLMQRLGHAALACRAHSELQASHARFNAIAAGLPDVIFDGRLTEDGDIIFDYANASALEVLGVEPGAIRRLPPGLRDRYLTDGRRTLGEAIAMSARNQATLDVAVHVGAAGQRGRWLRFNATPLRPSPSPRWAGTIQDITARELLAESELQLTRGRLSALLAAAADAIIVADDAGLIVEWNLGAEHLLGYRADSIIGEPLTRITPGLHRVGHTNGMERHRQTGHSQVIGRPVELPALHADGHEVPVELLLSRVENFGNVLFVGVLRDLSARHAADRARAAAVEKERLLASTLAELAHLPILDIASWERAVIEIVADALAVPRVGIWYIDGELLTCAALFTSNDRSHHGGMSLSRQACPAYFEALATAENIIANDAASHPVTREFSKCHKDIHGVVSMLGVPIRGLGGYRGVVCVESLTPRVWEMAEVRFCEDVAAMLVQANDNASRRRLEARHAMVLASIGEGVVACDEHDRIVLMNPVAESLTGWTATQAMGRPLAEILPIALNSNDAARATLGSVDPAVPSPERNTVLRRRDGTTRPIACNHAPMVDGGVHLGAVVSFRDVATELAAKRALELQNEHWRSLGEALPDLLFTIGIDGHLVYRGGGAPEDLLVPPGEASGHTLGQLFPEHLAQSLLDAVSRAIELARVETVEYAIDVGAYGRRHFEVRIARMSDSSATGLVRNVTAERERENALRTERERLDAVLGTTSAILYSALFPGVDVEYISDSATDVLGFSSSELRSPGFWVSALHPDDVSDVLAGVSNLAVNGHHVHEYRHRHANGGYRWLRDEVRLVNDAQGHPVRAVGASFDITERKFNEQRLQHLLVIQQIVASASAAFLKADGSPDGPLEAALQRICEHVHCDRAYVFAINGTYASNTHEWCAAGVPPYKDQLQNLPAVDFAFFFDPIRDGHALVIPSVSALPDSAAAVREILGQQGIESLVAVPMSHHGVLLGFLGVDNPHLDPLTLAEFAPLLQILADTLSTGQQRLAAELSLRSVNETLAARNRRQRALVELSAALAHSRSKAEVDATIADRSCDVLGAARVYLAERFDSPESIRVRVLEPALKPPLRASGAGKTGSEVVVDEALLAGSAMREALEFGAVISTRAHCVDDFVDWKRMHDEVGIRHFVVVPMAAASGIVGTLNVGFDRDTPPDDDLIAWCSQFAAVLTAHIVAENARQTLELVNMSLERVVCERTAELRASESRFSLLFEKAPQAMLLVDPDFLVAQANAAARDIFGFSDHAPRVPIAQLLPPGVEGQGALMAGYVSDPEVSRKMSPERHVMARRLDGGIFDAEIVLQAIALNGAQHIVAGVADITARRVAERSLVASLHEKEILLKEIHHRVKNNLQMISGLLSLQSSKATSEETRRLLDESVGRVRSMALIHQQIYGVESLDRVDFGAYVRELADSVRALVAPRAELQLMTDSVMLSIETALPLGLILNELLTNAFKYGVALGRMEGVAPNGLRPDVRITLREIGHELTLSVGDAGPGLPADFDPVRTGTLGMRLVRMLVSQLRATLRWTSDGGACFSVTLSMSPSPV